MVLQVRFDQGIFPLAHDVAVQGEETAHFEDAPVVTFWSSQWLRFDNVLPIGITLPLLRVLDP